MPTLGVRYWTALCLASIQRIGQLRDTIHVVNTRYAGTVENDVYTEFSDLFNDIFAVLGQLPDFF